jgi:DNA-directed RNA polymerase subunit RPC12/RpoP
MPDDISFVSFVCSACSQELEAPRDTTGQTVECPACGAHILVSPPALQQSTQAQLDAMKSRTIRIELGDI